MVGLSIIIAILASYTALALTGRVALTRGSARQAWLLGGSIAMGIGIWSMHFVAMLAFRLPVQIAYDVPRVAVSLLAAIAASALALVVASKRELGIVRLLVAASAMGGGIAAMHYIGMAAMRLDAELSYDYWLVALSLLIAVTASAVALFIFHRLRNNHTRRGYSVRAGAAVILGFAIAGLHYTAMTAAHFAKPTTIAVTQREHVVATGGLAATLVICTLLILLLTVLGSVVDHWVRVKVAGADALSASEERYRSVVSQVHEVIFHSDADGKWVFLNPAWTEITGYTVEESLGQSAYSFVHPDDRDGELAAFNSVLEGTDDSSHHEARFCTKNGEFRWIEVHARVNRDADGKHTSTAGTLRDVTDRRQSEEALRAARATAEAANRAKSEFLSRMSHELRTPLNAILGFGQLLEIEDLSDDNRESVEHILRGGRHLLDLINEVLDLTGIEAGRLRLSSEPVGASEVVREVVDLLRPLSANRNLTLRAHAALGSSSFVMADRQRMKQVLLNLVNNAIKYNREGGTIEVYCEESANHTLRIVVKDTGPGIAPDKMQRLFTPFDRLGAEQSATEGTGLGLAVSKRLAEAMNGTVGADSRESEGSTFWLELPLATVDEELFETATHSLRALAGGLNTSPLRMLYVEDNLANLALVTRIIARRPEITLIPCMQGELALDLARLHTPDLILLDLHLPDIHGEEVLARLKRAPETANIPVIVVSADATPGQTARLLESGASNYLTKPIDVKRFVAAIDDTLHIEELAA